jgi:type IV pilus assembly protein PilY1
MKYWATDLMSGSGGTTNIANEVPTSPEDPAFWQHMTTFTLGLGFTPVDGMGTTTPSDDVALASTDKIFAWANGGSAIPGFSWPTPSKDNINNIADLEHAAVNGHGGFFSATSPAAFTDGIKKALERVSGRVGTGASLAANSTQLKSGAFAYQANYYAGSWAGDLKAIGVDPNNGTLATTLTWSAADPKTMPTYDKRNIWTYNAAAAAGSRYVTFKNTSSTDAITGVTTTSPAALSPAELTALGSDATAQQNMINYLRGDASLEKPKTGGIYRTRTTPLGDIVNSQPVFVGQPDPNQFNGEVFAGSDTFGTYAATTRNNLIFVAANDGMLHAFDAGTTAAPNGTGTEVYAYLPAAVITTNTSTTGRTTGDLATLADPDYGTSAVPHQFFNDGELTVADVYFAPSWRTVVVGTTGRGPAKAVYALDVTDPTNIKLLWERSAGDGKPNSDYIGQMTGKPVVGQTGITTANPSGWSVLIGNGYNSTQGKAALLQFAVSNGDLTVHTTDATSGNGLAAPAVWMDNLSIGISTMAYAGDAQGRVWSFVLNEIAGNGSNAVPTPRPTSTGTLLFKATDGTTAQPITSGMLIGKNPVAPNDLWLFFGTGQYLNSADLGSRKTQSWYGLIVKSTTSGLAANGINNITRSNLVHRSIIAETPGAAEVRNADGTLKTKAVAPARAVTALPDPSDMGGKSGWYIDLLSPTSSTDGTGKVTYTPDQTAEGERIVTPNQFQGNQLLATTRIPQATDLCNPSGRGWIMAVDPFTGTNPKSSFFDLNGDGMINQPSDWILVNGVYVPTSGIGFDSLPNNPIFMGGSMLVSFDNGSATSIQTSGTSNTLQRVSWRELIAQ